MWIDKPLCYLSSNNAGVSSTHDILGLMSLYLHSSVAWKQLHIYSSIHFLSRSVKENRIVSQWEKAECFNKICGKQAKTDRKEKKIKNIL